MAVPPKLITKPTLRFCRTIVPQGQPQFIRCNSVKTGDRNECYGNVARYCEEHGGEAQHGWAIWEYPKVYIEAEFHCVWRSPENELIDITPNLPPYTWILFLPDPKRIYRDRLIDNIRKPLRRDKEILDLHRVCEEWYRKKKLQFEPDFEETPEWRRDMLQIHQKRMAVNRLLERKFGHILAEAVPDRMASQMPENAT
ncbi:MAG: hypothetical protein KDN20_23185 [Verrucomicrobiae bacterium]|nr:hypothetical protein [Verrucomicrobiae bacterium]